MTVRYLHSSMRAVPDPRVGDLITVEAERNADGQVHARDRVAGRVLPGKFGAGMLLPRESRSSVERPLLARLLTSNALASPVVDKRPLVIGPIHMIGVSSEHDHAQRAVLFRTGGLRHHRLTPAFVAGFAHQQLAKRPPRLRPPAIQGSEEPVMGRPRAGILQLTNTPKPRDTLLPASHSSL